MSNNKNNKNIDKILNSSNELDEMYNRQSSMSSRNYNQQESNVRSNQPARNNQSGENYRRGNISKVEVNEDIRYVDDEENFYIPKHQKVTITRNVGKIFDVPNDAVIQTMKDNQIYKKNFSVKIIGVGGAGNNIIKYVYNSRKWPDFVSIRALNTDYVALKNLPELEGSLFLLGKDELNGNGSGGDPEMGKRAATADAEQIKEMLEGTDILIIVAGLGKGTGTGASPVIAEIAKELGILTIGLFNLPSVGAEGNKTYSNALSGLEKLSYICNGFTAISNDRIIGLDRERTSIKKAYQDANEYMRIIIDELINIVTNAADVNIDFADIKNFFADQNGFLYLKVDVSDYTKDAIKEAIVDKMEKGFTDIDIIDSKNAIFDFKINENVPSIILENSRSAMREIVKTNDLNIVNGISFSDKYEDAEINILIAGKFDLGKISRTEPKVDYDDDISLTRTMGTSSLEKSTMRDPSSTSSGDDLYNLIEEYNYKSHNNPNNNNNGSSTPDNWASSIQSSKPEKKKGFFSKVFKK